MPDPVSNAPPTYRAFHMNPHGGIARAEIIDASSDAEAIRRVHGMDTEHAIELWDRARFIRKISSSRPADAI